MNQLLPKDPKLYTNGKIKLPKGDDTMKINIDAIKTEVQTGTTHYIMGIKFVTNEPPETVINTIRKDFMIYKDIDRIVVKKDTLQLKIENATLYTFYFFKKEVLDEVVSELDQFGVQVLKL